MRAVDTNVLVRLVTGDNADQTQAAERFTVGGVWVSHLVLAETTWVLQSVYGLRPVQIQSAIEMLLDNPALTLEAPDVVLGALASFSVRPALKFSDCLILEIARKAGHVPVGTFDKDFAKVTDVVRVPA